ILGENMSSRLFQVIREDRGLAYSVYSTLSFFADIGDLVISVGLDTVNVSKALSLIIKELGKLKEFAVGSAELRRVRDYAIGQIDLGSESIEIQMNWVGEQLLGYGSILLLSQIKKRLARVTAREIQSVATDFLRPERFNVALVSPMKNEGEVQRA